MKRSFMFFLLVTLTLLFSTAFAADLDGILPDADLWGISVDELVDTIDADCEETVVGEKKSLLVSDVDIDSYTMSNYYVFGKQIKDTSGKKYLGLSKIAYIWDDGESHDRADLNACYEALVESMKASAGEPDSEGKSVTAWEIDDYKIEIGKGKFSNYTGSDEKTVAIVITGLKIPKRRDLPTPDVETEPLSNGIDEYVKFKTSLIDTLGWNMQQYLQDTNTRALFTVALALDLLEDGILSQDEAIAYLANPTFVVKDDDSSLRIFGTMDDPRLLSIIYFPSTKMAAYMFNDISGYSKKDQFAKDLVEMYAEEGSIESYYENPLSSIDYVMHSLLDAKSNS